jgi:hypothetical protein
MTTRACRFQLIPWTVTNSEPVLRPGVNFTNRGELKYSRAVHLTNELRGRIDEWSAAETLLARIHQVDEHTVEFRMVVKREAPIDEWSLILGDTLHNLRSVFDNVIWALATLDGAKPKRPRQVTFPVTRNEDEWTERISTLESVPFVYLERVKRLQPWVSDVERDESMLWLLHQFDIIDKHRGLISGALHFKELSTAGLDLNYQPTETAAEARPSYTIQKSPIRAQQDTVLTTIHCATHTLHPDAGYMAKVAVQFFLAWEDDRIVSLNSFLGDLISRTREWLDRIYGGELYAKSLILARESTEPNITMGYEDESGELRILKLPMTEIGSDRPMHGDPDIGGPTDGLP